MAVDTDRSALNKCDVNKTIEMGTPLTKGLGCVSDPEIGRLAGMYNFKELIDSLEENDVVLIIAGIGGGFSSGFLPELVNFLKAIRQINIILPMIPGKWEGENRQRRAKMVLDNIEDNSVIYPLSVDDYHEDDLSVSELFAKVDEVVGDSIKQFAKQEIEHDFKITTNGFERPLVDYKKILSEIAFSGK
ncbi:MAG: hypothetical protein ABEK50_00330 [bacterium]